MTDAYNLYSEYSNKEGGSLKRDVLISDSRRFIKRMGEFLLVSSVYVDGDAEDYEAGGAKVVEGSAAAEEFVEDSSE